MIFCHFIFKNLTRIKGLFYFSTGKNVVSISKTTAQNDVGPTNEEENKTSQPIVSLRGINVIKHLYYYDVY